MTLSAGKLKRMKALANERGVIAAAAMDQRGSLQKALATARGVDVNEITPAMMSEFKVAVSRILTPHASAILLDPEFGLAAGTRARAERRPAAGLRTFAATTTPAPAACPTCCRTSRSNGLWIGAPTRSRS